MSSGHTLGSVWKSHELGISDSRAKLNFLCWHKFFQLVLLVCGFSFLFYVHIPTACPAPQRMEAAFFFSLASSGIEIWRSASINWLHDDFHNVKHIFSEKFLLSKFIFCGFTAVVRRKNNDSSAEISFHKEAPGPFMLFVLQRAVRGLNYLPLQSRLVLLSCFSLSSSIR